MLYAHLLEPNLIVNLRCVHIYLFPVYRSLPYNRVPTPAHYF